MDSRPCGTREGTDVRIPAVAGKASGTVFGHPNFHTAPGLGYATIRKNTLLRRATLQYRGCTFLCGTASRIGGHRNSTFLYISRCKCVRRSCQSAFHDSKFPDTDASCRTWVSHICFYSRRLLQTKKFFSLPALLHKATFSLTFHRHSEPSILLYRVYTVRHGKRRGICVLGLRRREACYISLRNWGVGPNTSSSAETVASSSFHTHTSAATLSFCHTAYTVQCGRPFDRCGFRSRAAYYKFLYNKTNSRLGLLQSHTSYFW